jgi:hypothetical protein
VTKTIVALGGEGIGGGRATTKEFAQAVLAARA